MASQITQLITPLPDAPDRTDRDNFPYQMSTFFSGEQVFSGELIIWTSQANALATGVTQDAARAETAAAAAEVQVTAELWSYASTYNFPQIVVGADGQAYRSLTNDNDSVCPHQYNRVTRVGATDHRIQREVSVADPSGQTYVLKVKMWLETVTGTIQLSFNDASTGGELEASIETVSNAIAEYSVTHTYAAGSNPDVQVRINPVDDDGPDGDSFGVYAVFLYDADIPGTNILTGDSNWQTDVTGWTTDECTIELIPAPVNTWAHIQALPDQSWSAGKVLSTDGARPVWVPRLGLEVFETSGTFTAKTTSAKVTIIGGGDGGGGAGTGQGGSSSFVGPSITVTAPNGMGGKGINGDINGYGGYFGVGSRTGGSSLLGLGRSGVDGEKGSGGAALLSSSDSGRGGGYAIKFFDDLVIGDQYTIIIGAGGVAGEYGRPGGAGICVIEY